MQNSLGLTSEEVILQPVPVGCSRFPLQGEAHEVGWAERALCHHSSHPALPREILLPLLDHLNGHNFPGQQNFRELYLLMGLDRTTVAGSSNGHGHEWEKTFLLSWT